MDAGPAYVHDRPNRRWSSLVAILAAYLTAVQLVFGGLAPASAKVFDPAQVLCTHAGAAVPSDPDRGPAPAHPADCCLSGCCMAGHGMGLPSIGASLPARAVSAVAEPCVRARATAVARLGHTPRQTRAPPAG